MANSKRISAAHIAVQERMLDYASGLLSASDRRRTEAFITKAFDPLCRVIAGKWSKHNGVDHENLLGDARMGVAKAMQAYDPVKYPNVPFAGFIPIYIENEVRGSVYRTKKLSAPLHKYLVKMDADLRKSTGVSAGEALDHLLAERLLAYRKENGEALVKNYDEAAAAVADFRNHQSVFGRLFNPVKNSNEDGAEIYDLVPDDNASEGQSALLRADDLKVLREIFAEALSAIPDRDREIFLERKRTRPTEKGGETNEFPLEVFAARFNISRERVRQLEGKAQRHFITAVLDIAARRGVTMLAGVRLDNRDDIAEKLASLKAGRVDDNTTPVDPATWVCPE